MEIYIAVGAVALIVGLLLGTVIGSMHRKRVAEKEIGSGRSRRQELLKKRSKPPRARRKSLCSRQKRKF